jgi:Tfp pilus assembly protein PilF
MERINRLKEFLAASPGDSFLKHALALEYVKLDNDTEARKIFEEILTNDPSYIGSYYHLAKLFERIGDTKAAIDWYEKGMQAAKLAGDHHALNELRAGYEELVD